MGKATHIPGSAFGFAHVKYAMPPVVTYIFLSTIHGLEHVDVRPNR